MCMKYNQSIKIAFSLFALLLIGIATILFSVLYLGTFEGGFFYKYKDKVFEITGDFGRKAILSFKVEHEKGVLSSILNGIAEYGGNVLTINQDMPIRSFAYVTITIDTKDLTVSVYELMSKIKKIQKIKDVNLLAFE